MSASRSEAGRKKEIRSEGLLDRFSITTRILAVVALLCLPYPFLLSLLILEQNRAIDFGQKEILGSDYLARSTPHMLDIAKAIMEGRPSPAIPEELSNFHRQSGSELQANTQFQELQKEGTDSLSQSMALNKRVGDYSNLILDPDLDSYYLMDIVLLRIPYLIQITVDLQKARSADDPIAESTALSLFDATLQQIQDSMETSFEENSRTSEILKPGYEAFLEKARSYRNQESPSSARNAEWNRDVQAFFTPTNQELRRLLEVRINGFRWDQYIKLGGIAAVLLIAFLALWSVVLSILRPVRAMERRMQDLGSGEGDLTLRLEEGTGNELARSAAYFNQFAEKLRASIANISSVARDLDNNGNLSMDSINVISEGLQNQAASLEQVSAAMEEVSASADRVNASMDEEKQKLQELLGSMRKLAGFNDQVQNHIRQGTGRAQSLARDAQSGTEEMQNASREMEAIVRNTSEMATIGADIQEIAERINLLSLNASIEAARAGEYGRGFAVVASEVSRLADRTNESISRISQMMKDNGQRIQNSTEVIQTAVQRAMGLSEGVLELKAALVSIAEELPSQERVQLEAKANLNMLEEQAQLIYSIVREQKQAIQEASNSITEINNTAQNHAGASRHLTELSEAAVSLAGNLREQTSWFKTGIG